MGMYTISMVSKVFLLLFSVLVVLAVCGCDEPTPRPSSNYGPDYGTNSYPYGGYATDTTPYGGYSTPAPAPESTYRPPATDVEASDNAVMDEASAIQLNDPDAFTALMSADTLARVSGTPDLTTPDAIMVGDALRNARMVRAGEDAFVYETRMDGVLISFLVIQEDGEWKIDGL
jgi:hypothetical protein